VSRFRPSQPGSASKVPAQFPARAALTDHPAPAPAPAQAHASGVPSAPGLAARGVATVTVVLKSIADPGDIGPPPPPPPAPGPHPAPPLTPSAAAAGSCSDALYMTVGASHSRCHATPPSAPSAPAAPVSPSQPAASVQPPPSPARAAAPPSRPAVALEESPAPLDAAAAAAAADACSRIQAAVNCLRVARPLPPPAAAAAAAAAASRADGVSGVTMRDWAAAGRVNGRQSRGDGGDSGGGGDGGGGGGRNGQGA
jgi:hypothetical protein